MLDKEIGNYFWVNDNGEVSPATIWSAHKAVIREKIITFPTKLKCEWKADINKLEWKFHKLSKDHRCKPTPKYRALLESSHLSLNLALTTRAEKALGEPMYVYMPIKIK